MKSSIPSLIVLSLILLLQCHSNGALKILGIFPLHAPSHFIPLSHLMKGLANRGHEVHVVSHFPSRKPIPNYTDISLAGTMPQAVNNITYGEVTKLSQFSMQHFVQLGGISVCDLLSKDVFQQLLKTPKNTYDVIVVQMFIAHCFIAFGQHLNAPVVGTVTSKVPDWFNGPLGVPFNTAYMPSIFSTSGQSMTFLERLKNTLLVNSVMPQINYYLESEREHVEKYFGRKLTSIHELYDDVALLLVNSHHSLNGITPLPLGVIEVAGLHVHDDQQVLSPEIKKWLDDSTNGFVYFTFGSMIRIETCPPETLKAFYGMFQSISPVRVLLKIADPTVLPPGLPKNVKTSPWLPQVAVLKHPNIKVFITHGGLVGTQEAIAQGVPMIGLPIFADQHTNIRTYANKGIAIALTHEGLTAESLTTAVNTILKDPSYRNNIKTLAKLFNDRPMSALDTAIYWVEYVARHGNILKSPAARLSWWQYHLLDVYGSILFVVLLVLYIFKRFLTLIFKLICSRKSEKPKTSISKSKKNK